MIVCLGAVSDEPLYVPIRSPDGSIKPETVPFSIVLFSEDTVGMLTYEGVIEDSELLSARSIKALAVVLPLQADNL